MTTLSILLLLSNIGMLLNRKTIDSNYFSFLTAKATPTLAIKCVEEKKEFVTPPIQQLLALPNDSLQAILGTKQPILWKDSIIAIYKNEDYQYLWQKNQRLHPTVYQLFNALQQADKEGWQKEEYHFVKIKYWLDEWHYSQHVHTLKKWAALDILLSDAAFRYAHDLHYGSVPASDWQVSRSYVKLKEELPKALIDNNLNDFFDKLQPQHTTYENLKNALQQHRFLLNKILKTDSLQITDFEINDDTNSWVKDHMSIINSLPTFKTKEKLQKLLAKRIFQIKINMERWRWTHDSFGERFIYVNIPDYQAYLVEKAKERLRKKVIVGRPEQPTPVFSDSMEYMILNPTWYVPKSIAVNEILPTLRRNPHYLKENNMLLYQDDALINSKKIRWWSVTPENFNFKIRQQSGEQNSLGKVKFIFPNRYDVYIHDTQAKGLFNWKKRAFSHGCIRLHEPLELAQHLLPNVKQADFQVLLKEKKSETIMLPAKIPVFLLYFTVWPEMATIDETSNHNKEKLHFYKDIYQRDAKLLQAFRAKHG